MNKKCFVPDSIPELQKKSISINIGRPAKITARRPAEQILIENDYQNLLGHLVIQNETLIQLKNEIEYKLKKLKDEETSLNLLHKKYKDKDENNSIKNDSIKISKKEIHMNLFKNAQKEWEERKQELINGDYIGTNEENEIQNYTDNVLLDNNINFSLVNDSSINNNPSFINDFNYNNNSDNDKINFSNSINFNSINDSQINKPFDLSPDFSMSSFNLNSIDNLDTLDPNLMDLDIDFDMNLLDINLQKNDNIESAVNNLTETNLEFNENSNLINSNNNYLETNISNIFQEISKNTDSSIENNIIQVNSNISKSLDEISVIPGTSNSSIRPVIDNQILPIRSNEIDSSNSISNILNEESIQNILSNLDINNFNNESTIKMNEKEKQENISK